MREIPTNLLAAFKDQQGLEISVIVGINWQGGGEVKYSTKEFTGVYAYVQSFSSFESVSHVDGLGAVSSISVTFNDQFGHFKHLIDTINIYDSTTATVYLTVDGIELFDLFEGTIQDGLVWRNKEFSLEIASETFEKEIGYTPSEEDAPGIIHLNTKDMWPIVYNDVTLFEAILVQDQRVCESTEDVIEKDEFDNFNVPVNQTDDYTLDSEYQVILVGKERGPFAMLATGSFRTDNILELNAPLSSVWYRDINIVEVISNVISSNMTEQASLKVRIEVGEYDVYDKDGLVVDTNTSTGPFGEEITFALLQFMTCQIKYSWVNNNVEGTNTIYLKCIKQEGDILFFNLPKTFPSGAYNIHIATAGRALDIIYKIPQGTKIYIYGDQLTYAVDTKAGSTVAGIGLKDEDNLVEFDPSIYTVSSASLFSHPSATFVQMPAEIYLRFIENTNSKSGLLARVTNSITTDKDAIADLTGKTVIDDNPKTVHFGYFEKQDVQDIVPEIAWQTNKAVRRTRIDGSEIFELIDLTKKPTPLFTFTNRNIVQNSISYSISDSEKLRTVFLADYQGRNLLEDLQTIKYKKNTDKYGEKILDVDYYIFANIEDAKESFQFWRDRLSKVYYTISFTAFLDSFGLEIWDRVSINITDEEFYDPADGSPFTNTHTVTPISWKAEGYVREIKPNLPEGTIDFTLELDTFLGDSPSKPTRIRI